MSNGRSSESSPRHPGCIVALGGSAGALEALELFFKALPQDINAAFVVCQHMDPTQRTLLPDLMSRWTKLQIETARSGTRIQPHRIYIREPGTLIEIKNNLFIVQREEAAKREHHPIDLFMASLANDSGARAIGIILSGNGTDGTNGLKLIQQAGGRSLVQLPTEAKFPGMPDSAIASGAADRVMPAAALAMELPKFVECSPTSVSELDHNTEIALICDLLRKKTGHDFTSYKRSTVARRVERRLHANLIPDLATYIEFLENDSAEPKALLRDLLISVTQFFRDPEAFASLQELVIPKLFENLRPKESVRVWVPACATGEEAYTIAMLLVDYQRENHPHTSIQIFATDIDRAALEYARQGTYPETIAESIPPKYMNRFLTRSEKGYRVAQELREVCIFSEHSLLKHPPFSKIDLISCRNLFIYWEPELQNKILPVFHYALNPAGYLFLGPAESLAAAAELYKVIDKKHRIFQRVGGLNRNHLVFPINNVALRTTPATDVPSTLAEKDVGKAISTALLENYAPPAFVVSPMGEIAYYSGRTGKYIEPPTGVPSNNIFDVIMRPMRPELHALLHRSIKTKAEASHSGLVFERDHTLQSVNLSVRPLEDSSEDHPLYLIVIQEVSPPKSKDGTSQGGESLTSASLVQQLEEELRDTREHLQSTIEEVKSSNEELLSMNEELQSANEELQTSKEELQSTNEELETVNSELAKKVDELDESNSDLQNFFHGTQIPILYLDRQFKIQKFTPAATKIFRLIASDIGRGILDITALVSASDLIADCAKVLDTLQPIETEVKTKDQDYAYLMRITPYRTLSNVIAGVIITFSDVTELKRAQSAKATLAAIVESTSDAIVSRDRYGNMVSWNAAAEKLFGYSAKEAVGRGVDIIVPPDKKQECLQLEKQVLEGGTVSDLDTERVRKDGQRIEVTKTMSPIRDEQGKIYGLSVIYRDLTERRRNEIESSKMAAIVKFSNDAIISKTLQSIITSWNQAATEMFGYTAEEMIGKSIKLLIPKDKLHEEDMILSAISRGEPVEHYETVRKRKDGSMFDISVSVSPIRNSRGIVVGAAKIARDITLQKKTEADLKEAVRARDEFLSIASHELKTPLTSLLMQTQIRRRRLAKNDLSAFTPDQLVKMVKSDERQISRLARLVDDMLDVARISTGKLTLKLEPTDLGMIVEEVAERYRDQLEFLKCTLEVIEKKPTQGVWDRFRIEQVVTNLLSNASKYGAGYPIVITIDHDDDSAILKVIDKGIGIALHDQERIFMQFERAVSRNDVTGLGLGLYIVKQIITSHKGSIRVESNPGEGAVFTVTLPLHLTVSS